MVPGEKLPEETVRLAREAYDNVRGELGMKYWELDEKIASPFQYDKRSDSLVILIIRQWERKGLTLDLGTLRRRDGAITVRGLEEEIKSEIHRMNITP